MTLHLGQSVIRGSFEHYARHFDLFELLAEPGKCPRTPVLKRWRASVPGSFTFSVVLPPTAACLVDSDDVSDLDGVSRAADTLEARWLVIKTPRSVTPTTRYRERLAALVGRLQPRGPAIAWQPEGLWAAEDAQRFANTLDICWVGDVGRDDLPARTQIYTRLRSIGSGGQVGGGMLERAAERLAGQQEAFVILEGRGAAGAAKRLRDVMNELGSDIFDDSPDFDDGEPGSIQ